MGGWRMNTPTQWSYDQACKALHKYKSMWERVKFLIEDGVSLNPKDIKEIERQVE